MTTLLVIIHVLVSLFLIFIVLVQGGKGAELGAAFGGGSSQTLFGSRGAATFLNKLTTVIAIVFMVTSLVLAIVSVRTTSVIKKSIPAAQRPTSGEQTPAGQIPPPSGGMPPQGQMPPQPGQPPVPQAPPAQ